MLIFFPFANNDAHYFSMKYCRYNCVKWEAQPDFRVHS